MPRISQLPDTAFPSLDHEVPASNAGETHRLKISQIRSLMNFLSTEITRPGEGAVTVEAALEALQSGKASQSDHASLANAFTTHLEQFDLLDAAFDAHVTALVNAGVGGVAPAISNANNAEAGSYHSFVGDNAAGVAANFPAAPNAGAGNRTWFLSTIGTAAARVQIAFLASAAVAAEVGFTYVRSGTGSWRRYMMADEGLTEANKASVVRYDVAQTLTATERGRIRANAGLGSPAEFATVSLLNAAASFGEGQSLVFRVSNGGGNETWRLIVSSVVHQSSATADLNVNYGFNFLYVTKPIVSNGDATANPSLNLSTWSETNGGFAVTARDVGGVPYTGAYRINYVVLGRVS